MATQFTYTVMGHWPFPLDMLRHDGSSAKTQADQDMIDRLSAEHAPDRAAFSDVEITLVGPCRPNTARWESFSWSVPTDEDHVARKRLAREKRENDRILDGALAKLTVAELDVVMAYIDSTRQH